MLHQPMKMQVCITYHNGFTLYAGGQLWEFETDAAKIHAFSFNEFVPLAIECYQLAAEVCAVPIIDVIPHIQIYLKENHRSLAAGLYHDIACQLKVPCVFIFSVFIV